MRTRDLLRWSWAAGAFGLVAAACGDSTPVDPKTAHILTGGVIAKESTGTGSNCSVTTPISVSFSGGGDGCDPLYPGYNQPNATYNGSEIRVQASCCHNGQGNVSATFSPPPSPGGSTGCTQFNANNYNSSNNPNCDAGANAPSGTLTLNGVAGSYTVTGSCKCGNVTISFEGIPLNG